MRHYESDTAKSFGTRLNEYIKEIAVRNQASGAKT